MVDNLMILGIILGDNHFQGPDEGNAHVQWCANYLIH